jgi:EAL domain-containing protein (putative c-di-GMP-specific phosphodiesterase class I)
MRLAARLEQALDENRLVLRAQRIEPLAAPHGGGLHAELLVRLREIGVHYAQGFLLHQPEPARELLHAVVTGLQGSACA